MYFTDFSFFVDKKSRGITGEFINLGKNFLNRGIPQLSGEENFIINIVFIYQSGERAVLARNNRAH